MLGDSKSTNDNAWEKMLVEKLNLDRTTRSWSLELPQNLAHSGYGVTTIKSYIDAWLTSHTYDAAKKYIFLSTIVPETIDTMLPDKATCLAEFQYIIDAVKTKFPNAVFCLGKWWKRDYDANCLTWAGWVDEMIADNPGVCFDGIDENVVTKGADNGYTNTYDGVHYSEAGHVTISGANFTIIMALLPTWGY
jgi:hypothetical protein